MEGVMMMVAKGYSWLLFSIGEKWKLKNDIELK